MRSFGVDNTQYYDNSSSEHTDDQENKKSRSARNFDDVSYLDAILMPKQEKEAFDRYYYCKKTGKINSTSSMKTVVIDLTLSSDEEEGTDIFAQYNLDEM